MELFTTGKEIHSGYKLPLFYNGNETFENNFENENRLSLTFIERGSGEILYNNQLLLVEAPSILCLNETEVPKLITSVDFSAKAVYFMPSVVNGRFDFSNIRDNHNGFSITELQDRYLLLPFIQRDYISNCVIHLERETLDVVTELFYGINNVLVSQADHFWPCRSRSLLLELLVLLTRFLDNNKYIYNPEVERIPAFVNEIITYLQTNYQNKITLSDLAKKFNTNRTTLNKQFYMETNLSIIDYLIKHRVSIAAMLLRDTKLPVSEIMDRTGFNSSTHFWRIFKKHMDLSPSEYRNQYCWVK